MVRAGGLARYIAIRALMVVPTVLILYTMVFLILRVIPGDPITAIVGTKSLPPEQLEALREAAGLNKPYIVQYFEYLWNVLHGDFGESLVIRGRPIAADLIDRFPATLELSISSFIVSVLIGLVTGTLAASRRGGKVDASMRIYSVVAYTLFIPWFGMMLQILFGVQLKVLPISGRLDPGLTIERITGLYLIDSLITGNIEGFKNALAHLVLPTITLGTVLSGAYTRLLRNNLIDVLSQDFIRAYHARGVRGYKVMLHAIKNAFIPVVTLMGLQFAILLGGAILTETTFSWPGMGTYLLDRIEYRDYTAIQGTVIFFALLVGLISLVVDIVYALLDPRIRY